jgi:hypothetical protein
MAASWQQPRISEIYPNRKPFMDNNGKHKDLRVRQLSLLAAQQQLLLTSSTTRASRVWQALRIAWCMCRLKCWRNQLKGTARAWTAVMACLQDSSRIAGGRVQADAQQSKNMCDAIATASCFYVKLLLAASLGIYTRAQQCLLCM